MPLILKVFTMNCGNSTPGIDAANVLSKQLYESNADLFILNCQEVDFVRALHDLNSAANTYGLNVVAGSSMATHTKWNTQFNESTGMVTIVLHKQNVKIDFDSKVSNQVRRESVRPGSGYNKGGMLTRVVAKKDEEVFTIDALNGHLDAYNDVQRAQDWANINQLQKFPVDNWQLLCDAIPHLSCSGFDMNTRNKFSADQETTCVWDNPSDPNMQGFVMAPLGNCRQSQPSTYLNTGEEDVLNVLDKKRAGCAKGGMLDLIAFNDIDAVKIRLKNPEAGVVENSEIILPPSPGAERDHSIIGSSDICVDAAKSDYERVRNAIICALGDSSPQIAEHLFSESFENESVENKEYLLRVYQLYLSPEGLLQSYLQLHADKLQFLIKSQQEIPQNLLQEQLFDPSVIAWLEVKSPLLLSKLADLEQVAASHTRLLELERLKIKFLSNAVSEVERDSVHKILATSLLQFHLELNSIDRNDWVKQTEQLLEVNKIIYHYERILTKETNIDSPLLKKKKEILLNFKETLLEDNKPKLRLNSLMGKLGKTEETLLAEHRKDGWIHNLLRKIRAFLTRDQDALLTRGTLFSRDLKSVIPNNHDPQQEEPSSEQVIPK